MKNNHLAGTVLVFSGTFIFIAIIFSCAIISVNDDVYHVSIFQRYLLTQAPFHNILALLLIISGIFLFFQEPLSNYFKKKKNN